MKSQNELAILIQKAITPAQSTPGCLPSLDQDTAEISAIVTSIGSLVDRHDWEGLHTVFADEVTLDYTSLFGGAPETLSPKSITDRWRGLLPGFDETRHGIVIQDIKIEGDEATATSFVSAVHKLANPGTEDTWYIDGYYHHKLIRAARGWKVTAMHLDGRREFGSRELLGLAIARVAKNAKALSVPVSFRSDEQSLVGRLFYPAVFDVTKTYPTVVISGSWTSVKEQNPSEYAQRLASQGFIALTFDHRGFGQSDGAVRQVENPLAKVADIKNAVTYLLDLDAVDPQQVFGLGICAGGGYMAVAVAQDPRLAKLATVAGWYTSAELYRSFFGDGFESLLTRGVEARKQFEATGNVAYLKAIDATDASKAAMVGEAVVTYYGDRTKDLGNWKNEWAVMSYDHILNFETLPLSQSIKVPALVVHSDHAISPDAAREHYNLLAGSKKLVWLDEATQFDFYDQAVIVDRAAQEVTAWFRG